MRGGLPGGVVRLMIQNRLGSISWGRTFGVEKFGICRHAEQTGQRMLVRLG